MFPKRKSENTIVAVIDGGGRGSVLVHKYAQSKHVKKVIAIPGNDLMQFNTTKKVVTYPNIKTTDVSKIVDICKKEQITLVDVAQDNAVAAGLVDALVEKGIPTVGPTRLAGQIEWDKAWARQFGKRIHLPQPFFKVCHSQQEGFDFLKSQPDQPWFVKAAGLAEGKGALPAKNNTEAKEKIKELKKFGRAGAIYLIEEWLESDNREAAEEFSLFALSDGKSYKIIGTAQDHKRVNNFDEGENTGGMGCVSSPLVLTPKLIQQLDTRIIKPVITELVKKGRPYKGVLYLGGILIKRKGRLQPYVIEFNARWGDPEAQTILPGMNNDLFEVSMAIWEGRLSKLTIKSDHKIRVVVAGVSRGYPTNYEQVKGKQITGINEAKKVRGVRLYGASIKVIGNKYYVQGGRLFYIVGEGKSVLEARQKAYAAMSLIHIDGNNLHYRTDIGWRDVERLESIV